MVLDVDPNPFETEVFFSFYLDKSSSIRLEVFNNLGYSEILITGRQEKGLRQMAWYPSSRLPDGVYFAKLSTTNESIIKKILKLK